MGLTLISPHRRQKLFVHIFKLLPRCYLSFSKNLAVSSLGEENELSRASFLYFTLIGTKAQHEHLKQCELIISYYSYQAFFASVFLSVLTVFTCNLKSLYVKSINI